MKDVWFISGLGADKRAFDKIDTEGYRAHFVDWIPPQKGENLGAYARRLYQSIGSKHPIIVGLSLGGMMAIEMAKAFPVEQVILISSSKTRKELPWLYRFAGSLSLARLAPVSLMKQPWSLRFHYLFFGKQGKPGREVLAQFLENTDVPFVRWGMEAVSKWDNQVLPSQTPVFHIHGTADRILPFHYLKADVAIKGGSHLMVFNRAKEISQLLKKIILG